MSELHPAVPSPWTAPWRRLQEAGVVAYRAAILADPTRFLGHVQRFVDALSATRSSLDRVGQLAVPDTRIAALEHRYALLRAGLSTTPPAVRLEGPPLMIVAGIAIGVAGIAWAIAAYQYAVHLREQTVLLEKELVARVQASRDGRTLQPSMLANVDKSQLLGWTLLGGLALGAAGLAWRGRST